ncbi:MAG TPA: alpha/beta hydrolase [Gemmatimonadaceae bacterium]
MQPSRSGVTTTTPVPLHWVRYGPAGAPQLLVLHGGPGAHHDYLLPQMLRLAENHEVIFYDQRGGGRSRTADHAPITWRTHVHDLALLAREMELAPLTLVGYSWGGLLAMLYAADVFGSGDPPLPPGSPSPARMVLIDPAPVTWEARRVFESELGRRQKGAAIRRMREDLAASGLRERDPEAYRQRAFELSVAGYFAHPERARELTPFRVMGRVQQSVWDSLGQFDLRPDLTRISCPTLIFHGREDPIPLSASEEAARNIPNARLVVLDDSGHVPYVEAPDALFGAINSFLEETASAVLPPTRA